MRARALLPAFVALASCDGGQAVHGLDPDLNRMLEQPRGLPYEETAAFPDGQVMRIPPRGTVPFGRRPEAPPPLTRALLARGRERYEVFCAPCHAIDGSGDSVVASKMLYRPPPSLHEARIRALSTASLVRVIDRGYGFMPDYAAELEPVERWAVAGYVQALQLSRGASVAELPEDVASTLQEEAR